LESLTDFTEKLNTYKRERRRGTRRRARRVLTRRQGLSLQLLIVDEAQDLSPLQAACIELWCSNCPNAIRRRR
jgi:superfamily I DNA/RNA helicase